MIARFAKGIINWAISVLAFDLSYQSWEVSGLLSALFLLLGFIFLIISGIYFKGMDDLE